MENIAIIINNFNRLSSTKRLVDDLMQLGYTNIHILDNNSTYPPLNQWYKELDEMHVNGVPVVKVVRLGENMGQLALWNSGYINHFKNEPHIVYTDSDIQLNENTPTNFIERMIAISKFIGVQKVGLALQIDDLPDTVLGNRIRKHEAKYWEKVVPDQHNVFDAHVDTTFAILDPKQPFTYDAVRVAGNFTAKHIPWYTDWSNLSEEEQYVLEHLSSKHSTYKGYYLEWLKAKETNNI